MAEFRMPSLGADMVKGRLVAWRVKPGDRVRRGDIIAEVETEKGIVEIEVFVSGVVDEILVQPGEEVPVGTVMAIIRTSEGQEVVETAFPAEKTSPVEEAATAGLRYKACNIERHRAEHLEEKVQPSAGADAGPEARIRVSPSARKLAEELGVDLSRVKGTGPEGAIARADVERAAASAKPTGPAPLPPSVAEDEKTAFQFRMRRAIAAAMSRSNREIPHYYLETPIDMSRAMGWLGEENQRRPVRERLLPVVLLVKATALALTEVPALNGYWIDDRLQPQEAVHIGFAISLRQGGLIAPAIHHADLKNLDELMAAMKDLITRTRSGGLRSSEMTDATVTLTNLGELGVESAFGLIYPPQVALVSFGRIVEKPWAENGMIGIRQVVSATLAGDHRATDGRTGAQFLNALGRYLQEVEKL